MASSTNTSKTMQISLEKKCANLKSQLSRKLRSLDSIEEKLRALEENMTLVINENDK